MRVSIVFLVLLGGCFESASSEGSAGDDSGTAASDSSSEPDPECDPQTQRSFCDAGELVECGAAGTFEVSGCGTDALCAEGSDGADCVWRLGQPCDGDAPPICWDPGGVLSCTEGFWAFEGCDTSERCKQRYRDAACIPLEQGDCEYADYVPHCEGQDLVQCGVFDVETRTACEVGTACKSTLDGAACIDDASVACDPDESAGQCVAPNEVELCDPSTGWTERFACPQDDQCLATSATVGCFPADAQTCDPDTMGPTCTDGIARGCSSLGVTYEQLCTDEQRCAIDGTCVFGCDPVAACVDLDAEACAEPLDSFCGDETLEVCFDGSQIGGFPCPGCTEDDSGATCE